MEYFTLWIEYLNAGWSGVTMSTDQQAYAKRMSPLAKLGQTQVLVQALGRTQQTLLNS